MKYRCLVLLLGFVVLFSGEAFAKEALPKDENRPKPVLDLSISPLSFEAVEGLKAIRSDPAPEEIIRETHYLTTNEASQYLFYDQVKDLGGAYLGVGAEQNYLFAGWARSELMFLVDFDNWVVRLHQAYRVIFAHANTPDEFVKLWSRSNRKQVQKWIEEAYPDKGEARRIKRVYRAGQKKIHRRLKTMREIFKEQKTPTFLDDQAQFTHLKTLSHLGRIIPIRGDFTKKKTLSDIAAFLRRFCTPMRTVYLSNVEYYVEYKDGHWRKNFMGLPYDERSMVLHTDPRSSEEYRYIAQGGLNYREWLNCRCVSGLRSMRKHARRGKTFEHQLMEKRPTDIKKFIKKFKKRPPPALPPEPVNPDCRPLTAL